MYVVRQGKVGLLLVRASYLADSVRTLPVDAMIIAPLLLGHFLFLTVVVKMAYGTQ